MHLSETGADRCNFGLLVEKVDSDILLLFSGWLLQLPDMCISRDKSVLG